MESNLRNIMRKTHLKSPVILVCDRKGNSHDRSFRRIVKISN